MARYRILNLSGSYAPYVRRLAPSGSVYGYPRTSGSCGKGEIVGSMNMRRIPERGLYNRKLLGQAKMSEVGQAGFAGSNPYSQPATVPSWTQQNIGFNHAFVLPAFSSSQHPVSELNCYASSSVQLEISPRAATGSLFYEKQQRYVTKTYKVTGSVDLIYKISGGLGAVLSGASDLGTSTGDNTPRTWPGGYLSATSGVFLPPYVSNGFGQKQSVTWRIPIDVPDVGRLVDIKVWVEISHDALESIRTPNTSGTQVISGTSYPVAGNPSGGPAVYGLGSTKVALRSPNVFGFFSIPSWNDPNFVGARAKSISTDGVSAPDVFPPSKDLAFQNGVTSNPIDAGYTDIYRDAFILWDQTNNNCTWGGFYPATVAGAPAVGGVAFSGTFDLVNSTAPVWDTDRNMRTVFMDGTPILNPRHLDPLFTGSDTSVVQTGSVVDLSTNAPCVVGGANTGTFNYATASFFRGLAWGSMYPWQGDVTLTPRVGGLQTISSSFISGSPPPGWLTGPANTAATNEWPTTGSNLGPAQIRPVYPLVDAITEIATVPSGSTTRTVFRGSRPGLRGSQINGRWFLLLHDHHVGRCNGGFNGAGPATGGINLRQVRLEITYDTWTEPNFPMISQRRRFRKTNSPGLGKATRRQILRDTASYFGLSASPGQVSGSIGFEHNLCFVYVNSQDTYGSFSGITDKTGSTGDFAVFTRLTGALADRLSLSASLSVSGTAHALYSYLQNSFGTPFIPISSGSSVAPFFQFFNTEDLPTKSIISDIINPRPALPQVNRLKDATTRLGGAVKTSTAIADRLLALQKDSLS